MPRLVFTVTNDLNYDQRMIRICSTLQETGYEVCLIGRKKKNSKPLNPQNFEQKRLNCFFESGKLFYAEYNFRLFFYLFFLHFDLVCGIDLDSLLPAYLASRLKGKICVYDAHEYFTELPEVVGRPFTKKVWSVLARAIIPRLNYCYTVCSSLAEIFEKEYGPKFTVVRNVPFAEAVINNNSSTKQPKILLYQGALNDGRGIEQLLEAMQSIEGVELWLAGEGDLSEKLRSMVKKLKLESKVKFLGYLFPDQLKDITRQAHVGLNLLENKGLNYYYSLANKAFDYVQAEIPSINMDFPEYQKLNQEFQVSILVPDLKVETIRTHINQLIEQEELYQTLQANTRLAKLKWCWENERKVLIEFYEKIIPTFTVQKSNS